MPANAAVSTTARDEEKAASLHDDLPGEIDGKGAPARASPGTALDKTAGNFGRRGACRPARAATRRPPGRAPPCLCKILVVMFHVMATARPPTLPAPEPGAVLAKAVLAAAARLGVRQRALAAMLGSSEASVSRLQRGRRIDPASKEGELALLFLRLYRSLDALVGGDDEQARRVAARAERSPGAACPRADPERRGLVDVVQYLDALRGRL